MSSDNIDDSKLSLTVLVNKEKNKVLYAVVDSHLADTLLSFLTLPLGRIVRILNKHYGDEAPSIGSLSSFYRSIADLDASHFVTEGAKHILLNPTSTFEDEYKRLKLDITDSPPAEYIHCSLNSSTCKLRSVSMYYDKTECYHPFAPPIYKNVVDEKSEGSASSSSDGVFTKHEAFFIISDDLHILPYNTPLLRIGNFLGITDTDEPATTIEVNLGFSELMSLLRASLTSPTPLSDVILIKNKKTEYSAIMDSQLELFNQSGNQENSKKMCLKVLVHRHTGKVLYAKCKEDFVEFLLSFLFAPLGGVEHILSGKTCVKAIDNFYRSTAELIGDHLFKNLDTKNRLMKPNLVHGCVSKGHILPLSEESLPDYYSKYKLSSTKFPKGQGSYLKLGTQTYYQVMDDLTVTPFCMVSIISDLRKRRLGPGLVKEVDLQIGLKEGLSILKASLTSTSALTHALKTHKYKEEPNPIFNASDFLVF